MINRKMVKVSWDETFYTVSNTQESLKPDLKNPTETVLTMSHGGLLVSCCQKFSRIQEQINSEK